jgi:hypothetical protein
MVVELTWVLSMEGMCTSNAQDAMAVSNLHQGALSNLYLETNLLTILSIEEPCLIVANGE